MQDFAREVSEVDNLSIVEAFISNAQREKLEPKDIILQMRKILKTERTFRKLMKETRGKNHG